MATRKIRLTMSGTQLDNQGPIVDIDFNGVNLDANVDINAVHETSTTVKEYTVDVAAGTYNLDIDYKNDEAEAGGDDRNLYIDKIEFSNDGSNYEQFIATEDNCDLVKFANYQPAVYREITGPTGEMLLNPNYDETQRRQDHDQWIRYVPPGPNTKYIYEYFIAPIKIWNGGKMTFNITFS